MSGITGELALRGAWDETNQAFKTVPSSATTFTVELDHTDGDSAYAVRRHVLIQNTTATDCKGYEKACLYVNAGSGNASIEVSPVDSGNVWVNVATVAAGLALVKGNVESICASRIRVTADVGITYYLVVEG